MSDIAFFEPATVEEAVALLARHETAICLAGGATLVAMMNANLIETEALVSLQRIEGLRGLAKLADGTVRIGAMSRHNDTAGFAHFDGGQSVVPAAAARIANHVVRNMGTMGGSIAFADPAADYPPALVAAAAVIEVTGPQGPRRLPADQFFVDWYTTALAPGELVTAIEIPRAAAHSVGSYDKLDRVSGDYAIASVALALSFEQGRLADLRIAVGGCGPTPVRVPEAERLVVEQGPDLLPRAGAMIAEACDPVDDVRASADYRRAVVPRLVARAVRRAMAPRAEAA